MTDKEIGEAGATIAALVPDLMAAARVRGVAPEGRTTQSLGKLLEAVGPGTRLVIVDVQAGDAAEAVRRVRERAPGARVVAYGPHVAEAALAAAREAGADEVMPRGRFVREVASLVAAARG